MSVNMVVNYDMPWDPVEKKPDVETYLHRSKDRPHYGILGFAGTDLPLLQSDVLDALVAREFVSTKAWRSLLFITWTHDCPLQPSI